MSNVFGATVPTGGGPYNDAAPIALGARVVVAAGGALTAFRYYTQANLTTATVRFRLFDSTSTSTAVVEVSATLDSSVGWHTYALTTPYAMVAGRAYWGAVIWDTGNSSYQAQSSPTRPITNAGISITDVGFRTGSNHDGYEAAPTNSANYYLDFEVGTTTALTVDVGADQSVYTGIPIAVSATAAGGSGSNAYTWTKVNGPAGTFTAPAAASTIFTPSVAGTYTLRCIVTSGAETVQDDLVVTVADAPTLTPFGSIASSTGWTPTGGTVLAVLSDTSDSTVVTSSNNPTNVLLDGTFGPMTPPVTGQNFVVRARARKVSATTGTVTGRLYVATTLKSTVTVNLPDALSDVDISFPASDLTTITTAQWTTGVRVTLSVTAA